MPARMSAFFRCVPIGADEVNVLENAVAYATFANLGKSVTPHAALEVFVAPILRKRDSDSRALSLSTKCSAESTA